MRPGAPVHRRPQLHLTPCHPLMARLCKPDTEREDDSRGVGWVGRLGRGDGANHCRSIQAVLAVVGMCSSGLLKGLTVICLLHQPSHGRQEGLAVILAKHRH
jgi:hypothetical protein